MATTQPDLRAAELSLEELGRHVAGIYGRVTLARHPMSRWVQIVNDVTILGEDVRRDQNERALERLGKVLLRLLDFVGYYLEVYTPTETPSFQNTLSMVLRATSYEDVMDAGSPPEGPSRWIYAKYPSVCSKCGMTPCHCVVTPWIFENRREDPEPYEELRASANDARVSLRATDPQPLTLLQLVEFFNTIYRNQYYLQQKWQIVMHLTEEFGEATIELSRIQLLQEMEAANTPIAESLSDVEAVSRRRIGRSLAVGAESVRESANSTFGALLDRVRAESYGALFSLVGSKFKEEIADVFSWIGALITVLSDGADIGPVVAGMVNQYVDVSPMGGLKFRCAWCHHEHCSNGCLVTNGIAGELVEHSLKF